MGVIEGRAEVGAAAVGVAGSVGGATLAFAFPDSAESFHRLMINKFWRAHHPTKGCMRPECMRETRRKSPQRSTDGGTSEDEDWHGQTEGR